MITSLRVSVFNALIIDYLSISFRTLGHHPTTTRHNITDYPSYFLANFFVACFIAELILMANLCNSPKFIGGENLSKTETSLHQIYFDGLNQSSIKKSWFVRNFNLLFLSRYFFLCGFIFNLQYLQIAQAVSSLLVMAIFTCFSVYYQTQVGLFQSTTLAVFKLIQEVSMTVILVLINIFCFDSFLRKLSGNLKSKLVILFVALLVLNIILEILSVLVAVYQIFGDLCTKKNPVEKIAKQKSRINPFTTGRTTGMDSTGALNLPIAGMSLGKQVNITFKNKKRAAFMRKGNKTKFKRYKKKDARRPNKESTLKKDSAKQANRKRMMNISEKKYGRLQQDDELFF